MKLEEFGERGPIVIRPSAPSKKQKEFKPFLHERDTTGKILPSFCTSPINVQSSKINIFSITRNQELRFRLKILIT